MQIIIYEDPEKWKMLKYENIKPLYEISTYGNIRNSISQKMLKIFKNEKGYNMVGLMTKNSYKHNKTYKVHILVANTFINKPNNSIEKLTINHKNGNKDDNSIYNLEWVTFSENIRHSYREGLNTPRRGNLNGHSKYSEIIIRDICKLIINGIKSKEIIIYIKNKYNIIINKYLLSDLRHKKHGLKLQMNII